MAKFLVSGDSRNTDGVAICGDRIEVHAADEAGAIEQFKTIVPGSSGWYFEVVELGGD